MKKETYFILLLLVIIVSCKDDDPEPELDAQSTVIYQDGLIVDDQNWVTDSTAYHVRKFSHGYYLFREDSINTAGYSLAPFTKINFPYSARVDAIIQLDDPNEIGYVGIIFNYTDKNNFSIFEINNHGSYFIWKHDNGTSNLVGSALECPGFKTGNGVKNTLKVSQNANKMQLRINGTIAASYPSTIPGGDLQAGVYVGTLNTTTHDTYFSPTTGLFNNFVLEQN